MLFPHARIRALVGFGIFFFTRLSASLVIGAWFLLQFIPGITSIRDVGGAAYVAHVGGFAAGALAVLLWRPRRQLAPPARPPWQGSG